MDENIGRFGFGRHRIFDCQPHRTGYLTHLRDVPQNVNQPSVKLIYLIKCHGQMK